MNTKLNNEPHQETQLLNRAAEALLRTTGLRLVVDALEEEGVDARITLQRDTGEQYGPWHAEIKRWLGTRTLNTAMARIQRGPQPGVLVTDYINPRQAERLRDLGVAFIDTAGNAFIAEDALLMYVAGQARPTDNVPAPKTLYFRPTELKLILLYLLDPDAVNTPYRVLAEQVGIALGAVAQTMKRLEHMGYLVRIQKGDRQLLKRRDLLDQWVADYIARLRPTLVIGRYKGRKPTWWQKKGVHNKHQWGGEVAAMHWTQYLKPATATLYGNDTKANAKLLVNNGLAKDPDGDTELLQKFWPQEYDTEKHYVPPVIAYADLLAIGGARNMEAAQELYETKIAKHFKEP